MGLIQDFVTQNQLKCWAVNHASAARRQMAKIHSNICDIERQPLWNVETHQTHALRRLLGRAVQAPYWRALLSKADIDPARATLADLGRIPFLTKETLRTRSGELRLARGRGVRENYSGGSSGIPIRFWQDDRYRVDMGAATRRCNERAGAFPGARVAKIWGAPQDRRKIEGPLGRAKLWLLNPRYYDSFDMGPERMLAYHQSMEEFQPDLIQAYASSIYLMARYLRAQGIRPTYPRLSIITAAEKLFPNMREEIEAVFSVRVFDRYGSREASALASECREHNGLHIQMPSYIIETVDPATGEPVEEQPGEVVVTVLNNFALPFIRYRIGDMAVLTREACPCGNRFPRLRHMVGRTSDNFLMTDGRVIHGEYFTHLFYGRDEIGQFQFVQEAAGEFTLRLVPGIGFSGATTESIESELRQVLGPVAKLQIRVEPEIPKTASGKYRFTVSHVSLEALGAGKS